MSRRDERALLGSVHPNIRISFGDSGGIQAFRKDVIENRNEDFWGEFATILRALTSEGERSAWKRVQLADGRTGYMASRYVRSPIEHRALFEFENGRWWLMAYVAGD